jgi:hypothetical protein
MAFATYLAFVKPCHLNSYEIAEILAFYIIPDSPSFDEFSES